MWRFGNERHALASAYMGTFVGDLARYDIPGYRQEFYRQGSYTFPQAFAHQEVDHTILNRRIPCPCRSKPFSHRQTVVERCLRIGFAYPRRTVFHFQRLDIIRDLAAKRGEP